MRHEITERAYRLALSLVTMRGDPWFSEMVQREVLRQLVRAGTSVSANLEEATGAQTKADFVAKVTIAKKEALELQYWIRLAEGASIIQAAEARALGREALAVGQVISAIARKARHSSNREPFDPVRSDGQG